MRFKSWKCASIHNFLFRGISSSVSASETVGTSTTFPKHTFITAWEVDKLGGIDNLELKNVPAPIITKPNEILVKVRSTSVNPLDIYMLNGYGKVVLSSLKTLNDVYENPTQGFRSEKLMLPFIPGRDFAGEILAKGTNVSKLLVGDEVYGVVPPHMSGAHSEQIVIPENYILRKPKELGWLEAGSTMYTAITAWSSLKITGDMFVVPPAKQTVLVIGAAGGVGSSAVQMLKNWGSTVVAICRSDAIDLVQSLGADIVIDYTSPDFMGAIQRGGKYDLILDAAGESTPNKYIPFLKEWRNAKFISLRAPFLRNTDQYGLFEGTIRNLTEFVKANLESGAAAKGSTVRWGFFMPVAPAFKEIEKMISERKLVPVIDSEYKFKDIKEAYKRVEGGHLRGKVAVNCYS